MAVAWAAATQLVRGEPAARLLISICGGHSEVRGLLTLQVLADPQWRAAVLDQTQVVALPSVGGSSKEYESMAVEHVVKSMPGMSRLDPADLRLPKVRSAPDGLLRDARSGRVVVIEAKDRSVDFEEGASQLFQYAAQARWSLRCPAEKLQSVLVTSDVDAERKLDQWRALVRAPSPAAILVPAECAKHLRT